jgi:hypothetical protein
LDENVAQRFNRSLVIHLIFGRFAIFLGAGSAMRVPIILVFESGSITERASGRPKIYQSPDPFAVYRSSRPGHNFVHVFQRQLQHQRRTTDRLRARIPDPLSARGWCRQMQFNLCTVA